MSRYLPNFFLSIVITGSVIFACVGFPAPTAMAQDQLALPAEQKAGDTAKEKDAASTQVIASTSTADPEVDPALLDAMLRPLTLDEAQVELDAWLGLLKDKAIEIKDAAITATKLEGTALTGHQEKVGELKSQRASLVERSRIVAIDVKAKGGDPAQAELYIDQVASPAKPTGFASAVAAAQAWLTSEDGGIRFAINFGKFLGCLIGGWIVGGLLAKILDKTLVTLGKSSDLLRGFAVKMVRRVAVFVGLIIGLSYLGVNIGPLMAAIGAAGLVIGLALQGTLSNFASGLLILFYEPFDIGDVVTAGGITGKVKSMTLVNTVFTTADNQVVVVPNSKIWEDVITNVTASPTRRVDLVVGISYDDDIEKAKTVLLEIVNSHEQVLKSPEPQIAVSELGASSVDLVVRPWTNTADYWNVKFELTQTIKQRFDAEGLSFPYPQQDVYMHTIAAAAPTDAESPR